MAAKPSVLESVSSVLVKGSPYVSVITLKIRPNTTGNYYYRLRFEHSSSATGKILFYHAIGALKGVTNKVYTKSSWLTNNNITGQITSLDDLLYLFPDSSGSRFTVYLETFKDPNYTDMIGEYGTRLCDFIFDETELSPSWEDGITWEDSVYSNTTGVITGDKTIGLQGKSEISFKLPFATGKSGATIDTYQVGLKNGISLEVSANRLESSNGVVTMRLNQMPDLYGTVKVIFIATDSRGFTASYTKELIILPYSEPKITKNDTHRVNQTGTSVIIDIEGNYHDFEDQVLLCEVYVEQNGAILPNTSSVLDLEISGGNFSYKGVCTYNSKPIDFDVKSTYSLHFTLIDIISRKPFSKVVPISTPTVSIRSAKVGINNTNPNHALDVVGVIAQNNHPVCGFVGILSINESTGVLNLDHYTDSGYWFYDGTLSENLVREFPPGAYKKPGLLEVISFKQGDAVFCVQRYYNLGDGVMRWRSYEPDGGWDEFN